MYPDRLCLLLVFFCGSYCVWQIQVNGVCQGAIIMILFQTNCMPWSLKDNHQSLSFSIFAGHGNLCDCFSPKVTLFKKFDLKLNILTKNILRDATFRVFMTRLEVENDTFYAQSVSFCLEVNEGSLSKRTKVFLKILIRVWDSFRDMLNLLLIVTIFSLFYFKL